MLKGCQKKIIHIRNPQSPVFEEAYFVLKSGCEELEAGDNMIKEAMKIAERTVHGAKKIKKENFFTKATFILAGVSIASFVFAVAVLICSLPY